MSFSQRLSLTVKWFPPRSSNSKSAALAKRWNNCNPPSPGIKVERILETGDPVEVILRTAAKLPADLIVLGSHGRTGLARLLLGSVAEQVVRKATCPVLVVKRPSS
jgi:nucleotide-binding universal stress UspA family protein